MENQLQLILAAIIGILAFQSVGKCSPLTHVDSDKSSFGLCLTSQDNLIDVVDPRKLMKFITEMTTFKTELVRTKQYYQYCGEELQLDIRAFVEWMSHVITKVDTEIELSTAVARLIHKRAKILDGIHLEMKIEPLDKKIIKKAFEDAEQVNTFLSASEATECVNRLKKLYVVSDGLLGRFQWLKKLYIKIFKGDSYEEEVTRPQLY